jgi:recombination protein RecA
MTRAFFENTAGFPAERRMHMAVNKEKIKRLDQTMNGDKAKALDTALSEIEKRFGKGSVMLLGQNQTMNVDHISTGSLSLDYALGIGGVPRGRIVEIYGPESSGKTTIALQVVAQAQKQGGTAAFIDVEHALDPVYAANLGVDIDSLLVSQPDTGEQALEITEALIRSGAIDAIVIDSVAALVPKAEIEGEMGDSHVGVHARLMSQALRKLAGAISASNCVAIFINQLREKIGVMYGNPETTTGGRALKFYASVRMDIRRTETLKAGNQLVGNHTRVKVVKNKVAPPFREAEFDIMYGQGISREGELVDIGEATGIVKRSGAWYYYGELRLAQGRDKTKQYLADNPDLAAEIEEKVRAAMIEQQNALQKKGKSAPVGEIKPTAPSAVPEEQTVASAPQEERPRPKVNIDVAVDD